MRITVNVDKGDDRYSEMMGYVDQATDNNLVIVARGDKNKKDDRIKPISTRNGIYFYIANVVDGALVFRGEYTAEDIEKARENTVRRARFGGMMSILFGSGVELRDFKLDGPMNVITTSGEANGAGILLCTDYLRQIFNKIGDYYILPSSIHEVIVVPKESWPGEATELSKMVREINAGYVDDEDVLADECFEYSDWI